MLSHVQLFVTPWTIALQIPLSFSREEHWSGLPFPILGDPPDPGIEPTFFALTGRLFTIGTTCQAHIQSPTKEEIKEFSRDRKKMRQCQQTSDFNQCFERWKAHTGVRVT